VCSNTSLTVPVSAGDRVGYKASTFFSGGKIRVGAKFTANNGQYQTLSSYIAMGGLYINSYSALDGYPNRSNTAASGSVIPTNGVIDTIYAAVDATPVSTATITLVKNGVDTSLSCVIVGTTCSFTSPVSVTAGDLLATKANYSNAGVLGTASYRWSPSTPGEALLLSGNVDATPSVSATNYTAFGRFYSTTPTPTPVPYNSTVKTLSVTNRVAPSSGKSFTYTIRKGPYGSVSDTSLSCQVVNTNTSCSDNVNSVNITAGQGVDIKSVPNNTPTNPVGVAVSAVIVVYP